MIASKYRKAFLDNLPEETLKKIIIKTIILFIFGFFLSIIFITATLILAKVDNPNKNEYFNTLLILIQDIPLLLLTILLFFRNNFSSVFSNLISKIRNNSIFLFLGFISVEFLFSLLLNIFNFLINRTPNYWKWLESYVNSGPDNISLSYIQIMIISLISFLLLAFCEEFIFRFTLYRFLRKHSFLLAVLLSSIVFTFFHGYFNITAIIAGIIYCFYYEYSNNFIGVVVMHALTNQFLVYYTYYLTYLILK